MYVYLEPHNVTLFENVFADETKLRSWWIRVEINSMIGIIRKKLDTKTHRENTW